MNKDKKQLQLGMNPSTAANRLRKDLLFKFASEAGQRCYHCGGELTKDSFSIEHKEPWLDSDDPVGLFFDLGNIAYSHISCNVSAGRRPTKLNLSEEELRLRGAKQDKEYRDRIGKVGMKQKRRDQYLRTGK